MLCSALDDVTSHLSSFEGFCCFCRSRSLSFSTSSSVSLCLSRPHTHTHTKLSLFSSPARHQLAIVHPPLSSTLTLSFVLLFPAIRFLQSPLAKPLSCVRLVWPCPQPLLPPPPPPPPSSAFRSYTSLFALSDSGPCAGRRPLRQLSIRSPTPRFSCRLRPAIESCCSQRPPHCDHAHLAT